MSDPRRPPRYPWFLTGLFLTALGSLSLEVLNTRLLSVVNWYHLSFLAISLGMFGMSAGAVFVYVRGERLRGEQAVAALGRNAAALSLSVPLCHYIDLKLPISVLGGWADAITGFVAIAALFVPFYISGILLSIALTRIPGPIGRAYAVDLGGAALGCLVVPLMLEIGGMPSVMFVVAGILALAAYAFSRMADSREASAILVGALLLFALGGAQSTLFPGHLTPNAKGKHTQVGPLLVDEWNSHAYVSAREELKGPYFYWGRGAAAPEADRSVRQMHLTIDGSAGTVMTLWDGAIESLDWVQHDISALPYHLRPGGDAGVIGSGGGRDVLTALWARSQHITAIEINRIMLDLHRGRFRDFSKIAARPEVDLVHDEARSFLMRSGQRFDVLQMSLIDTWAATGAGAFTLSENGLYTIEGWLGFLESLEPTGIFSVSRWFSSDQPVEVSRLVALASATLMQFGVDDPRGHMLLLARDKVATLLVSPTAFSERDLVVARGVAEREQFLKIVFPGEPTDFAQLADVASASTPRELEQATTHSHYDLSPPTDDHPFFFNMLKPRALWSADTSLMSGNMKATKLLFYLLLAAVALAGAVVFVPLYKAGLPNMPRRTFAWSAAYFVCIGMGFMLIQVAFLQRFSVYLGHPSYALPVILFSMILFAGLGSGASDRWADDRLARAGRVVPVFIAAIVAVLTFALPMLVHATEHWGLAGRAALVVALIAPVSFPMGFCFPMGIRMVSAVSADAGPWMWGINGACSVVASVMAVAVSVWASIGVNLVFGAALYGLLAVAWWALTRD